MSPRGCGTPQFWQCEPFGDLQSRCTDRVWERKGHAGLPVNLPLGTRRRLSAVGPLDVSAAGGTPRKRTPDPSLDDRLHELGKQYSADLHVSVLFAEFHSYICPELSGISPNLGLPRTSGCELFFECTVFAGEIS